MVRISPGAIGPSWELAAFTMAAICGRDVATTLTAIVARFEDVIPSQAATVNESSPSKPAAGSSVVVFPLSATVPFAGWLTTHSVRVLLFGSLAESPKEAG